MTRFVNETENLFLTGAAASASALALGSTSNAAVGAVANDDDDIQLTTLPGGRVVVRHVVVQSNKVRFCTLLWPT